MATLYIVHGLLYPRTLSFVAYVCFNDDFFFFIKSASRKHNCSATQIILLERASKLFGLAERVKAGGVDMEVIS